LPIVLLTNLSILDSKGRVSPAEEELWVRNYSLFAFYYLNNVFCYCLDSKVFSANLAENLWVCTALYAADKIFLTANFAEEEK
jgi:hypothetical protein